MLHGVKAGAVGKHPAGVRRLRRRARVADPRRHFEGAELHRLVDRYFEMRDASGHLVERGKDGDRVLDLLGVCWRRPERAHPCHDQQSQSDASLAQPRFRVLHHAPNLLNDVAPIVPVRPCQSTPRP